MGGVIFKEKIMTEREAIIELVKKHNEFVDIVFNRFLFLYIVVIGSYVFSWLY